MAETKRDLTLPDRIIVFPSPDRFHRVRVRLKGLDGAWEGWECEWCSRLFIGENIDVASLPPHECLLSRGDVLGVER